MVSKLIKSKGDRDTQASKEKISRKRSDGQETRAKILDVARQIIMHEGTDRLTLSNICEKASISRGTYLYHFHERNDLIKALAQEYAEHLHSVFNKEIAEAKALNAYDPYLAGYDQWYREFSSRELDNGESPLLPLVIASRDNAKYMSPVLAWYRQHFDELKKTPNGHALGLLLSFAYDGLFFHHLFGIHELTNEEKASLLDLMQILAQRPVKLPVP